MRRSTNAAVALVLLAFVISACSSGTGASPSAAASAAASAASSSVAASPTGNPNDLLAIVKARGYINMATDVNTPPQSVLQPDGSFSGFDIDVARVIIDKIFGKDFPIHWITPSWDVITAGNWGGRWDFHVQGMTVTAAREKILDFSNPYFYVTAQMSTYTGSGITSIADLAGKTVCVGQGTTYQKWLDGESLGLGQNTTAPPPPANVKVVTFDSDALCAQAWKAGRHDFQGWLTAKATADAAIADGQPVVEIDNPIYQAPLAAAFDKSGPPNAEFLAEVNKVIAELHQDGTLKTLSVKSFKVDLTEKVV
jgi:polar amino acid transport system substrate-binding protein